MLGVYSVMGNCGLLGRCRGVRVVESELGLLSLAFWRENLCELKRLASFTTGLS